MERQTKEEQRIIERTKEAILKEVDQGARNLRQMGVKLTKILKPLQDLRCNRCVSEWRFPKRPWTRDTSMGEQYYPSID